MAMIFVFCFGKSENEAEEKVLFSFFWVLISKFLQEIMGP